MSQETRSPVGTIDRQLSPISFSTADPAGAYAELLGLGGTPLQPRGTECGRIRTEFGGLIRIWESGLICVLGPSEHAALGVAR